jgi:hypothetical protein
MTRKEIISTVEYPHGKHFVTGVEPCASLEGRYRIWIEMKIGRKWFIYPTSHPLIYEDACAAALSIGNAFSVHHDLCKEQYAKDEVNKA